MVDGEWLTTVDGLWFTVYGRLYMVDGLWCMAQ